MFEIRNITDTVLAAGMRVSGWIQYGRKYDIPVRPDRVLWLTPDTITHKPVTSPETDLIQPTLVVGGDWDRQLTPITDDIVYHAFHQRFVENASWEESGYIDFLTTTVSEHGGVTRAEAMERCRKLDQLYAHIKENGYKTQAELERRDGLIDGLTSHQLRPPTYREVCVDVTRDGEFVWHGGMHRLVIAQLLAVERIPVRVNIRHEQWQAIREQVVRCGEREAFRSHPDVAYLISD